MFVKKLYFYIIIIKSKELKQIIQNMIKRYLFSCIALLSIFLAKAQDPEMTQYYAAPIYTNPAMAGTGLSGYP